MKEDNDIGEDAHTVLNEVHRRIEDLSNSEYGTEIDTRTIHASQLGYCPRQMYVKKFGLEEHPEWLQKVFRTGTCYHAAIESWIEDLDGTRSARLEVPMTLEEDMGGGTAVRVVGRADVLTRRHVIDWKTMSGIGPVRDDGPKPHHVRQLMAYLEGHDRGVGVLHYMDKKTGEQETFTVEYDDATLEKAMRSAALVMRMAEKVKLSCEVAGVEFNHAGVRKIHQQGLVSIPLSKCQRDDGDPCFMCRDENLLEGVKG